MIFIVILLLALIECGDTYINCYFKYKHSMMNMRRNDDDNNIKYIHKPTTVNDNDPLTLIDYVIKVFPDTKRTQAKQWLSYKSILVNNEPQSQYNLQLYPGDVIAVRAGKIKVSSGGGGRFSTLPVSLKVVFEDESILIVDKPANMKVSNSKQSCSTSSSSSSISVFNHLTKIISKKSEKIYLISHLDDEASGLIVFAKTNDAKIILSKNWKEAGKTFVCLCHDTILPLQGIMKTEMIDNNNDNTTATSISKLPNRVAISNYRTIQTAQISPYSLVEISLVTNYREQLRYQLACSGHAIVGDNIYISKKYNSKYENIMIRDPLRRLAMHCSELKFTHPVSKETMTFTSEIPRSFKEMLGHHNNENVPLNDIINDDDKLEGLRKDRNVKILTLEDFLGTNIPKNIKK